MGGCAALGDGSLLQGARIDASAQCIACGDSLYFLPDAYPLSFHCENGHFLTLSDLLDEALNQAKRAPAATGASWAGKARLLRDLAGMALRCGHTFTAADFHEAAARIDGWVAKLRTLLTRGEHSSPAAG